ncbi:MAG: 5-(carboxyamino)imidazole ribonucleotide synthase [Dehalococcoidia bacterium]
MIVGVLGGGQLGQMLALAGIPLGMRFRFFEPAEESCVDGIGERVRAGYDDLDALGRFAEGLDVVTYEFENVPVAAVEYLATLVPHVYPPAGALAVAQDRLTEKTFLEAQGVPCPPFAAVSSEAELREAAARLGLPAVLKTRRFGYDGKGQVVLRAEADLEGAWEAGGGAPSILERFVPFEREASILAVRGRDGDIACYPLVENRHREGILRLSVAPGPHLDAGLQAEAERHARAVLEALGYVGVLAIEFFVEGGRLLANEMAPRVHNSGHWTIEGAATSQFENHLRAVLGLPLGSTAAVGWSAMLNLIGALPDLDAVYRMPDAHVHLYGKSERPGRKLGHVTVRASGAEALSARVTPLGAAGFEVGLTPR